MKAKTIKILTTYRVHYLNEISLDEAVADIHRQLQEHHALHHGHKVQYRFAATSSKLYSMRTTKEKESE